MRLCTQIIFAAIALALPATTQARNISDGFSYFMGVDKFSNFEKSSNANGETILTSPEFKAPIAWDELVVSWNAITPPGTYLKIEARGIYPDHATPFYTMGLWSEDPTRFPRESVRKQKNADGNVSTDTLILTKPGANAQVRLTFGSSEKNINGSLKFLGLSFCDTKTDPTPVAPHKAAWGKVIETPERSQNSYPEEQGWCSPTSLSMVLMRWSKVLNRPEMNLDVPDVAKGVFDKNFGTGNWPFNAAFGGKFDGMRGYISRFNDISAIEDWISAGIPVIISAPFHLLAPGRKDTGSGHVVLCIGFTEKGDVVINDPATNLQKGQKVQHIYKRADVVNAWSKSHNTVYLIYPESAKIPKNRFNQWEKK